MALKRLGPKTSGRRPKPEVFQRLAGSFIGDVDGVMVFGVFDMVSQVLIHCIVLQVEGWMRWPIDDHVRRVC